LIASELFGHEKGAFTGALQRRAGRFESADGGTIFLDEIGELSPETQIALLRVLQEREFERVGGTQSIHVDVRVVAATNRDLKAAIANGTFREDLYYQLNVFPIQMPPLRERKDDVLTLLEYFVERFGRKLGKTFSKIDKRTVELFRSYDWPGNVRELQNVVERSVIVSPDDVFCVDEAWLSTDAAKTRATQHLPEPTNGDSGRERQVIEAYSQKAEAESTELTELQPSFEFRHQLLIPRSRNCKFARAASNSDSAKAVLLPTEIRLLRARMGRYVLLTSSCLI
jgi:transcriptional regulator with GAF, ATPase, and Fis domain